MSEIAFLLAFVCVCLGYCLSSYFGGRSGAAKSADGEGPAPTSDSLALDSDAEQIRALLRGLQDVATTVDHEVDRHNTCVSEISEQLSDERGIDAAAVLAAAGKLVAANKQLQNDLASAKDEIQTQQQELETYMVEARMDPLTRLANRRAFDEDFTRRFAQWQRQGTPFSVLMIDVDHFKQFNDQHGHQTGDAVLRGVARVLQATMRTMDVVTRYGGEEFAVLLPGTGLDDAQPAAVRVCSAVADAAFHVQGTALQVTVSVGLAEVSADDRRQTLVKRADAALYSAKDGGRNCSYYHDGTMCLPIRESSSRRQSLTFNCVQRVASAVDGKLPEPVMFRQVTCEDISPNGFSYLLREPPEGEQLVLALGSGSDVSYRTATVNGSQNIGSESDPIYRVVCQFTARVDFGSLVQEFDHQEHLELVGETHG